MTADEPCPYPTYDRQSDRDEQVPARGSTATGPERSVWRVLESIDDPEMPISIVDLGLIYGVTVDDGEATIQLTLTYSGCPARDMLTSTIEQQVEQLDEIDRCTIELVWNPPWTIDMLSEAGKTALESWGVSVQ